MAECIIHVEKDADAVAQQALQILVSAANKAISQKGYFVLVLAGGNTPKTLYTLLKNQAINWQQWFLLYGDERCLPLDDPERNSVMVEQAWLDAVSFPQGNHFTVPAGNNADAVSYHYNRIIAALLPADLALLGIGEDGHTASLFPENMVKDMQSDTITVAVHNAPKPPPERISLGYKTLNSTKTVCFLVTGEPKQEALKGWRKNMALPCSHVQGTEMTLLIADKAACPDMAESSVTAYQA